MATGKTLINEPASPRLSPTQMVLLLVFGTESVFFATLLSAFIFTRASLTTSPLTGSLFTRIGLPSANTLVLLASLWVVRMAVSAARHGEQRKLRGSLWLALLMGLLFVTGQIFEFSQSGMSPGDITLGGMYFALIGFHALHVLAGMVMLALLLLRAYLGDFANRRAGPVSAGYWFWIYVSAVWVVLFAALYLI